MLLFDSVLVSCWLMVLAVRARFKIMIDLLLMRTKTIFVLYIIGIVIIIIIIRSISATIFYFSPSFKRHHGGCWLIGWCCMSWFWVSLFESREKGNKSYFKSFRLQRVTQCSKVLQKSEVTTKNWPRLPTILTSLLTGSKPDFKSPIYGTNVDSGILVVILMTTTISMVCN